MCKYFLPLIAILCLLPMIASAAFNDVQFTADTNIYLTTPALTLTIAAGSRVEAMTVSLTNISFDLRNGSIVTISSAVRKTLTANPAIASVVCGTNVSYITLQPTITQTVTVTPGDTCAAAPAVPPAGGGGGAAPPTEPPTPPTVPGEGTVTASGGGEASATTAEGGGATIEVPANAVAANTVITVTPVGTAASLVGSPPAGSFMVGGYVYNFSATSDGEAVTTFTEPVTLTFTYADAQITGLNESTLTVYRWDTVTSEWTALPSTVNTATNTVTATTTEFSEFALIGEEVVGEEEEEEEEVIPISEMTIAELKAKITEILAQVKVLQAQLAELIGVATLGVNLKYDNSGDDVELLQTWLAKDTAVYPEGLVTGWFGPLTKAAVVKFQEKYADEVLAPWGITEGTGFVGSSTREKLNALYSGQ